MSAYKFQTPGNHPKESKQHSVHGESLKSRLSKTSYLLESFPVAKEIGSILILKFTAV